MAIEFSSPINLRNQKTKKMDRSFVQTVSYQSVAVSVKDADNISFYSEKHDPQQKEIYDLYIVQNIPNYT